MNGSTLGAEVTSNGAAMCTNNPTNGPNVVSDSSFDRVAGEGGAWTGISDFAESVWTGNLPEGVVVVVGVVVVDVPLVVSLCIHSELFDSGSGMTVDDVCGWVDGHCEVVGTPVDVVGCLSVSR